MTGWYKIAADAVLVLHVSYVAFVVIGLLLILLGGLAGWRWVRNFWFRVAHLLAITIVVTESWFRITCPLTTLENTLRSRAGLAPYEGSFIATWLHRLLFYDLPPTFFTMAYTTFGVAVLVACVAIPPRRPKWFENRSSKGTP